jgi:hypothetical protein
MDNISILQQLGIESDNCIVSHSEDEIIYKYYEFHSNGITTWSYTKYIYDDLNINTLHHERHV